jgi:hypothetical protein
MPANLLFLPNKYTRWYFAIIKNAQVRTQSPEHVTNRSGVNHPGYGKELDSARKEKIRQGVLNMPLHTCEHCGKTTTKGNYKRWHSDNCKVILGV